MFEQQPFDDSEFHRFPALARCLLVEPQLEVRAQIVRSLKASVLFEEILESNSLVRVAAKLQNLEFDAALFGPSLKPESIADFVGRQRPLLLSKDCAFITIGKQTGKQSPTIRLRLHELHNTIGWPCSKKSFTEGIVRGVLSANKNTAWPGVKLSDDGQVMIRVGGQWQNFAETSLYIDDEPEPVPAEAQAFSAENDDRLADLLQRLIAFVNREDGEPIPSDAFSAHFEACVKEWLIERSFENPGEALKHLRNRLLAFKDEEDEEQNEDH